jgi:VanZ family protein
LSARAIWLFRIALFGAVAFAVTMALLPKPPNLPIDQFGDKFSHMLAFATMALLAALAYPRMRLVRIGERLSFLGALVEVIQSIPSLHRDCDIHDWVADTIAITVVLVIVATIRRRSGIVGKTIH